MDAPLVAYIQRRSWNWKPRQAMPMPSDIGEPIEQPDKLRLAATGSLGPGNSFNYRWDTAMYLIATPGGIEKF